MKGRCTAVLDVGKTNAKLTLWDRGGTCVERLVRANMAGDDGAYPALDLQGLEAWVRETLLEFAARHDVAAIVPVTHGAAAVLVHQGRVFAPPMDYEIEIPESVHASYRTQRDPFAATGSPDLPRGLNLGAQLHYLELLTGPWPSDLQILLWPQFWAWRFCGVFAGEVTSLGCHTDLWRPSARAPTQLSNSRGWAGRFGPLRRAGDVLGNVTPDWRAATGLPDDCRVLCGLHDSNAALLAARGHAEIARHDATVLSTGTWFVAMRSLDPSAPNTAAPLLDEGRDCLVNVDVDGRPVPSARFMGGRESEIIAGIDTYNLTENYDPAALIDRLPGLIGQGTQVLPTFVPEFGPFPARTGRWINEPPEPSDKRAALGLYLALMADVLLEEIGSKDRLLVEGRFAEAEVFIRALASLRPDMRVYVSNAHDDVPYGALRLIDPELKPRSALTPVPPLDVSLESYRASWRAALKGE